MTLQLSMFAPQSDWKPPRMDSLPSWKGAKRVAIDIEGKDEKLKDLGPGSLRKDAYITGVSFCIDGQYSAYLPFRHFGGDNLQPEQVMAYLRQQAAEFEGEIVGANLSYDLDFLKAEGIWFGAASRFRDIMIAEALINEHRDSYSLENIAKHYLGIGKDERLMEEAAREFKLKNLKKEMWKLPARFVGPYATTDAVLPLQILERQEQIITDENLWQVYNLESDVLPVLVKMKHRGVRIDQDKLSQVETYCLKREHEFLAEVKAKTGVLISPNDLWKPDVLTPALEYIGVDVPKTATGKNSIKKDILNEIKHPVAECLQQAREFNKIRTTFAQSVRDYMIKGRIHCNFNQLARDDGEGGVKGAKYGRLSANHPNLQQQPARHPEMGKMWRSIYLPDLGGEWGTFDYSQQEPRMTVHFAELCRLPKAFEAGEKYRTDPTTDNHQMMADMANIKRKAAKEIFLGLCYGMGGAKLAHKLGMDTKWKAMRDGRQIEVAGDEAQDLLDRFDAEVPFVKKLAKKCEEAANQKGYITTLSGRRCRFPKLEDGSFDWTHKALNRLIQGSSADQTKMAMVAADREGLPLQLQVHDEFDMTIYDKEEARKLKRVMLDAVPGLKVPSKVDVEIGPNWGDIKECEL